MFKKTLYKVIPLLIITLVAALSLFGCSSEPPIDSEFIINSFLPNWWIIVAQIVAMIVLFIILYKFVWKSGNKTLTDFQDDVKKELDEAQKSNVEAFQKLEDANKKFLENQEAAKDIKIKAEQESQKQVEILNKQAHSKIDKMYDEAQKNIQRQEAEYESTKKDEIVDIAFFAAEKLLEKELDEKKHNDLIEKAIKEFGEQ